MKNSREQHAEENKSFEYGLNGRLTSLNGSLSYSSIKGTFEIYNNPMIIKYLGYFAFADELVLMVKYNERGADSVSNVVTEAVIGANKIFNIPFGSTQYNLTNELSQGATEEYYTSTVEVVEESEALLENNYNAPVQVTKLDLSKYYTLSGTDIPNYKICEIEALTAIPEYNKDYKDAFIVLRNDGLKAFTDHVVWKGNLNWDINRKITTAGIYENQFFKRVYFTDNLNP